MMRGAFGRLDAELEPGVDPVVDALVGGEAGVEAEIGEDLDQERGSGPAGARDDDLRTGARHRERIDGASTTGFRAARPI